MLLGDIIVSNAIRYPDKLALVDGDSRMSWQELNERVNRMANCFLGLGMSKEDRIAIISDNCHQYVETLFACAKSGLIAVCMNYRSAPQQLSRMMNITQPKAIIVQDKFTSAIESIRSEFPFTEIFIGLGNAHGYDLDYESLVIKSAPHEPSVDLNEDDGYAICFSSGTTGEPKAALISHKNRFTNAYQISVAHAAKRDNIFLLPLAIYTSLSQQFMFSYSFVGGTLVILNFNPEDYMEAIEKEKVDTVMINYTLFTLTKDYLKKSKRDYNVSSVKLLRSAGQGLSYEQWREVVEFFHYPRIIKGLAMTEAGMVTSGMPEEFEAGLSPDATAEEKRKFNSLGKPLINCQVRVVDENDQDLPPGEPGEVICKGDNVIKILWNQPHLTEKILKNSWLYTGDLAMIDEDGYLYLMGRKDDRIRTGGYNVYPTEIEEVLARHPAVKEPAVFGVEDERWAEMIMAAVIIREDHQVTEDELKEYCRKHLARYQVPKKIYFVKEFPRHPVWKRVLKKELAQRLADK